MFKVHIFVTIWVKQLVVCYEVINILIQIPGFRLPPESFPISIFKFLVLIHSGHHQYFSPVNFKIHASGHL